MASQLERIVAAHGSFPAEAQVLAGFDGVLALATREPAAAVAAALLTLIDQHGAVATGMPADLADRLCDWVAGALARPDPPAADLARILVNAGTPRSLAMLKAMSEAGSALASAARPVLGHHPLMRPKPAPA